MSDEEEVRPVWISRARAEDAGLERVWDESTPYSSLEVSGFAVLTNRWAAFTDDELAALAYPSDDPLPAMDHLIDEVDAEIERRKA